MSMTPRAADFVANLFPWRRAHVIEQVAGEVARECLENLWQRVSNRTSNMSLPEIRGYVRAQAAACVNGEVEHAIYRRRLKRSLRRRITDAAMDQLVAMVAHDVLCDAMPVRPRTLAA